ncbi:MAG: 2-hydroxyacyl-CoA dehydratase [bacterium]|nr:MAG: 2-hydroxyacyl-CoA dehydratase [bacterium]
MIDLNKFQELANNSYEHAERLKKQTSKKIIGYFCSYTPEEIIHAANALPFRIFGSEISIVHADTHLQPYCCSLARGGLEEALAGRLNFLDGMVFPHTCDTIQRLSDIWRLNAGFPLHFDVMLPSKLNSESAHQYLIDILHKFKRDLEKGLGIEISSEQLKETIRLYNQIRKGLEEIYLLRSENPDIISGSQIYAILKSAMIMDRKDFQHHLSQVLSELKKENEPIQTSQKKRTILTGGICNHPDIYSILEESGGVVVWDDLCTGTRYFSGDIDENVDPIEAIAKRYFERVICPTKHATITYRGENLVRLAKEKNADGVIFLFLKFCDPHAFDYPFLKEYLDKEAIPNMLLEVGDQLPATGQVRTRLEAFVEML